VQSPPSSPAILWLCGPPGVGKTTAAWALYRRLVDAGTDCAFVDLDQLGICYPAPPSDPERHRLKARNLAALALNFAALALNFADRGASGVIVSGVVDARRGVEIDGALADGLITCRLTADPDRLLTRLAGRQGSFAVAAAALQEAEALDRTSFADFSVDTSGRSVDQVVARILASVGSWPPAGRSAAGPPRRRVSSAAAGELLWLWGPPGVGKSTIGFRLYLDLLERGVAAGYVDAAQVGFCSTAEDDHRPRADNLADVWHGFHEHGARALVVAGPIRDPSEVATYQRALPAANFTWVRLTAGEEALRARVMSRQDGGSWPEPGDRLKGRSASALLEESALAAAQASSLARVQFGQSLDTTGLSVQAAARQVLALWGRMG